MQTIPNGTGFLAVLFSCVNCTGSWGAVYQTLEFADLAARQQLTSFDTLPEPTLECEPYERSLPESLSARTGRFYARVVHAPGWPLHGRVSFSAGETLHAGFV